MGSFAEQLINGVSRMVILRSRSDGSVRLAITPGTVQPKPTSIGTTSAGQTDLSQKFIHYKGHPRHVAAVFQKGQEEKQGNNNRKEA